MEVDSLPTVSQYVSDLISKKTAIRIGSMKQLSGYISSIQHTEELLPQVETIIEFTIRGLNKSTYEELEASCHLLELILFISPESVESIYKSGYNIISQLLLKNTTTSKARECLGVLVGFLGYFSIREIDEPIFEKYLQLLHDALNVCYKSKIDTQVAAIKGIVNGMMFLASGVSIGRRAGEIHEKWLNTLMYGIEHVNATNDLKSILASGLAFLIEATLMAKDQGLPFDYHNILNKSQLKAMNHDDILGKLIDIDSEINSGNTNKKDRSDFKNTFRDVLSTIEDGILPSTQIIIGNIKVDVEGWCGLCQLSMCSSIFQNYWTIQLQNNNVLGDIFGYIPPNVDGGRTNNKNQYSRAELIAMSKAKEKSTKNQIKKERLSKYNQDD